VTKVLVTGAGGMLARAALPAFAAAGHEVRGLARAELDVTELGAVRRAVTAFRPDAVLHLASFTHVDRCETESDRAFQVNAAGARNVAQAAAEAGAVVVALSSDYVFGGDAATPYREYDAAAPRSVYGASKWAGEQAIREVNPRHQIVRTSWLFGAGGPNFVDTVLGRARAGEALRVVDDQRGSPTWTGHLAEGLVRLLGTGALGTFHCTNRGECTWYDLAAFVLGRAGVPAALARTDTASFPRPARRPAYSVLSPALFEHATAWHMPPWQEGVERHLSQAAEPAAARRGGA
jgi:dTDP-4-dehydrorhamnose reductase